MHDAASLLPIFGHAVLFYTRADGTHGWTKTARNAVTNAGVNWLLETAFRSLPQSPIIYAGLITNAGFVGNDPADTHASHPGWTEWTSLASVTRPTWTPAAAVGGVLGTTVAARFNITAAGQVRGLFLSTIGAVGSTAAGVLYNTVVAVSPLSVEAGGVLDASFAIRLGE